MNQAQAPFARKASRRAGPESGLALSPARSQEQGEHPAPASCLLPTPWATFTVHAFCDEETGKEHLALTLGDVSDGPAVLARVHSECLTGDALMSQRCDCGAQLQSALARIAAEGRGALLYLRQEGRGIGLFNKVQAYGLQDRGADTVEANHQLGFPADLRRYGICRHMFEHLGITRLRLMTNNPAKLRAVSDLGFQIVEQVPLIVGESVHNQHYLATKAAKMGHMFPGGGRESAAEVEPVLGSQLRTT